MLIYDFELDDMRQIPVNGVSTPIWSPTSDMLMVGGGERYLAESFTTTNSMFIYHLQNDEMLPVSEAFRTANPAMWTPNGQYLIYTVVPPDCEGPCVHARNLYSVRRDGQEATQISNISQQLPSDFDQENYYCSPSAISWSETAQRIYYTMNCEGDDEYPHDLVYSTTVNGDARLEASLRHVYPSDFLTRATHLLTLDANIYVAITAETLQNDEYFAAWRVMRIDQANEPQTIYEELTSLSDVGRYILALKPAPSGDMLLLSVINLVAASGDEESYQVIIDTLGEHQPVTSVQAMRVCNPRWLDRSHIILTEFPDTNCNLYQPPGALYRFDAQTGAVDQMDTPPGYVWIIGEIGGG